MLWVHEQRPIGDVHVRAIVAALEVRQDHILEWLLAQGLVSPAKLAERALRYLSLPPVAFLHQHHPGSFLFSSAVAQLMTPAQHGHLHIMQLVSHAMRPRFLALKILESAICSTSALGRSADPALAWAVQHRSMVGSHQYELVKWLVQCLAPFTPCRAESSPGCCF